MLLDRIDIDVHGPLHRVELGPFCEHLNVVFGPQGSGKTAIARFVRDSLVDRQYPLGMMSSSTGRVVWGDGDGLIHCRREKDGTSDGRSTIEFEPRGDFSQQFGPLRHSWISGVCDTSASNRAACSIQLPESIADGVITDTSLTDVARVVSACVRNGLDSPETYHADPNLHASHHDHRHDAVPFAVLQEAAHDRSRELRSQLASVEAEMARLDLQSLDYQKLVTRRSELHSRLGRRPLHSDSSSASRYPDQESAQRRLTELCELARELRARQSELRRWIATADQSGYQDADRSRSDTASVQSEARYRPSGVAGNGDLRRKLNDIDAQLIGWRRTLHEIRGLRESLLSGSEPFISPDAEPLDARDLRRRRLDGFLHSVDRYDRSRSWDPMGTQSHRPRSRVADIQQRIDSATRQIDWLLERYASADSVSRHWYDTLPASANYRATTTLGDTLRAIRLDLNQVRQFASGPVADVGFRSPDRRLNELMQCEQWLIAAIDQLILYRDSILHGRESVGRPVSVDTAYARQQVERMDELERLTAELDRCLAEAADIRRSLRSDTRHDRDDGLFRWTDREAIIAELRRIDSQLASLSRMNWLRVRRNQLIDQLGVVHPTTTVTSPLAESASRWLVRLSAGRLRSIDWPHNRDRASGPKHRDQVHRHSGVRINGRPEADCPAADRSLATLALRMAAGDLLASRGRQVPLVVETHHELFGDGVVHATGMDGDGSLAFYQQLDIGRSNHPITAALQDYTRSGRQVVLLTSNQELAAQIARVGGSVFRLHSQQVVHPHRPLWRPHYEAERYVGPHPHTSGVVDGSQPAAFQRQTCRPIVDINRDFDMAWRQSGDTDETAERAVRDPVRTDLAEAGAGYRDGYYFAETYTTVTPQESYRFDANGNWVCGATEPIPKQQQQSAAPSQRRDPLHSTLPKTPFFLSVDSPIDQAPSVDAVAAARLRGLGVTHIRHLMQQDSNRLADALGMASVNAATVRRWQAECRLVCRVPRLRGFDARVLVGCGVSDPAQLATIHPVDLLQEVEAFLATERGQQILLSGSSYELSRITSWIAAANSTPVERAAASARSNGRSQRGDQNPLDVFAFDRDTAGMESDDRSLRGTGSRRRRRPMRNVQRQEADRDVRGSRSVVAKADSNSNRDFHDGHGERAAADGDDLRSSPSGAGKRRGAERSRRRRGRRADLTRISDDGPAGNPQQASERTSRGATESDSRHGQDERAASRQLRFYLQRDCSVVDAPSIGPRMGERLGSIGIHTVDQLLAADPEAVAEELDHSRVTSDTVLQWQQQAELVCRVPMLRGHDAQLLVLAEVTTPEQLAASDPADLFGLIDPISRSHEGKRILRGGKRPDLREATEWIALAQHTRKLVAA